MSGGRQFFAGGLDAIPMSLALVARRHLNGVSLCDKPDTVGTGGLSFACALPLGELSGGAGLRGQLTATPHSLIPFLGAPSVPQH